MTAPFIVISLSGGGFRATFYHCGVMRALHMTGTTRTGELDRLRPYIGSVSGGTITGAVWDYFNRTGIGQGQELESTWPEDQIIELSKSAPTKAQMWFGWVRMRWRKSVWSKTIISWWANLEKSRPNKLGAGVQGNYHAVELLDDNSGRVFFFIGGEIFPNPFDIGKKQQSIVNNVSTPDMIIASTALRYYFPKFKLAGRSFMDAGLIDNQSFLSAAYLRKVIGNKGKNDADFHWIVADAGAPFTMTGPLVLEDIGYGKFAVGISLKDKLLRVSGKLAQQNLQPLIAFLLRQASFDKTFAVRIGYHHDNYLWCPTERFSTPESIMDMNTEVSRQNPLDVIAVMAYGAQTISSILLRTNQRKTLKNFYLGLQKKYGG